MEKFAIVTSCYNYYDRFLRRWANSIIGMEKKPDFINIVQSGPCYDKTNFNIVEKKLKKHKLKYNIVFLPVHKGMGFARNKAVELSFTDRIMYLDVDDTINPKALIYAKKYLSYDVICGGLEIVSINKSIEYKFFKSSRQKVLSGKWCCCSHAIYRRNFWKISPYIECNDFLDYPFWLGLAQKGATFIGTNEIFTSYLRRVDGHHLKMSEKDIEEMKKQKYKFIRNGVNSLWLNKK